MLAFVFFCACGSIFFVFLVGRSGHEVVVVLMLSQYAPIVRRGRDTVVVYPQASITHRNSERDLPCTDITHAYSSRSDTPPHTEIVSPRVAADYASGPDSLAFIAPAAVLLTPL